MQVYGRVMQFYLKSAVVLLLMQVYGRVMQFLHEKFFGNAKLMQVYGRVMQFYLKSPVVLVKYCNSVLFPKPCS
jgi:hypothetical protein